ncbi:Homeobox protein prophet of Pit-1 [Entophlyctis sp. JEL0112]|nr:Homeobox protein prophet of Pit-1 [Entophlyctis sp. JEL0112]
MSTRLALPLTTSIQTLYPFANPGGITLPPPQPASSLSVRGQACDVLPSFATIFSRKPCCTTWITGNGDEYEVETARGKLPGFSTVAPEKTERDQIVLDPATLTILNNAFGHCPYPTRSAKEAISEHTGLSLHAVQLWFQNRRAQEKQQESMAMSGTPNFSVAVNSFARNHRVALSSSSSSSPPPHAAASRCCYHNAPSARIIRHRLKPLPAQTAALVRAFDANPRPDKHARAHIAAALALPHGFVTLWWVVVGDLEFQNRRSKIFRAERQRRAADAADTSTAPEPVAAPVTAAAAEMNLLDAASALLRVATDTDAARHGHRAEKCCR